ncbi:MAG: PA domain-containing protein [Saprospiraceae bacterium]|nr:PA domain-containing protein [Saprospiraceae bacterium]
MKKTLTSALFSLLLLVCGVNLLSAQTVSGGGAQNDGFVLVLRGPGGQILEYDQALPCQILGTAWGGDVTKTPQIKGDLVFGFDSPGGQVDSFLCDTVLNNYTGKIVVVRRGVCAFSDKTLNAQRAGAIAVIALNNAANPADCATPNPGAGATAGQVTIPTVTTSMVVANQILGLLNAGTVEGEFVLPPFGPRDVKIVEGFYTPSNVQTPEAHMGTDTFAFSANVLNSGTETATNVVLVTEVQRANGSVIVADTVFLGDIIAGDTVNSSDIDTTVTLWPPTVANGIVVGTYNLVHKVFADGNDARPSDNASSAPFIITDFLFAKEDGNIVQASRPSTLPSAWHWGNVYTMSAATQEQYKAVSVVINYATNAAPDPQPNEIQADISLFRVNDDIGADFSGFDPEQFPPEQDATFVGFGSFQAPSDAAQFQDHEIQLLDFNTLEENVVLDKGARYIAMVSFKEPFNTVFLSYGDVATLPGVSDLLYITSWSGGFVGDPDPYVRLNIGLVSTTDERPLADNTMRIVPNPVSETLNLQFDFAKPTQATITLADMTGKVITIDDRPSLLNDQLQYPVTRLAPGTYLARVATPEGTLTKQFVVVK